MYYKVTNPETAVGRFQRRLSKTVMNPRENERASGGARGELTKVPYMN